MGKYQPGLYEVVTPVMGALAVVLNLIEIGFIVRRRKTWRLGKIYLLSLAVSDVIVGLMMIFLKSMHPFMKSDLKDDMVAKEVYNIVRYCFIRLSLFVSVLNLVVLVLDREWAIARPFSHRKKMPSFTVKACLFVWILSMICVTSTFCMVRFYGENVQQYYDLVFPVVTYLTTLVFTICYIVIFRKIRNSQTVRKQSTTISKNQRNTNFKGNVEVRMHFLKSMWSLRIVS